MHIHTRSKIDPKAHAQFSPLVPEIENNQIHNVVLVFVSSMPKNIRNDNQV